MGPRIPSCFVAELKKALFNPSSTSLRTLSTSAYMTNRPSLSLPPLFLGESPHRTVIECGVFSTTSKWSVILVPTSYVEVASALGDQRLSADVASYFWAR